MIVATISTNRKMIQYLQCGNVVWYSFHHFHVLVLVRNADSVTAVTDSAYSVTAVTGSAYSVTAVTLTDSAYSVTAVTGSAYSVTAVTDGAYSVTAVTVQFSPFLCSHACWQC